MYKEGKRERGERERGERGKEEQDKSKNKMSFVAFADFQCDLKN
jgi:hypothetical protein